jgi:hypothetical protein
MKFKKLVPLFLLLVISIQVLPLQRIAVWLTSGQITEDIAHGLDSGKSKSLSGEKDPALLISFFKTGDWVLPATLINPFHSTETLWIRDADEILTPPPNA